MIIVIKMQENSTILVSSVIETRKGTLIHVNIVNPSATTACRATISEHRTEEVYSGVAIDAVLEDWDEFINDIVVRSWRLVRQHRTIIDFDDLLTDKIKAVFAMECLEARVQILKSIGDGML